MTTPYDEAMRVVCEIVQSQMVWPSRRMLEKDLRNALRILTEGEDNKTKNNS